MDVRWRAGWGVAVTFTGLVLLAVTLHDAHQSGDATMTIQEPVANASRIPSDATLQDAPDFAGAKLHQNPNPLNERSGDASAQPASAKNKSLFAGSRIPMERCPTSAGELGIATPSNQSKHVNTFPACKFNAVDGVNDKDYMVKQLGLAPTMRTPFASSTYFCNLLPSHVYREIIESFPPDKLFPNHAAKERSCGKGGCRYSMTAQELMSIKRPPASYVKFGQARLLYQKLLGIVFSREFEAALFKKLGVTKAVKSREFRILSDKHGYSNGRIHTDMAARKVATMMWYLPVTDRTAWDYGTCLHSTAQWKARSIKAGGKSRGGDGADGEGDCYVKFRFLPNTGYSFKAGPASWHSAPNFFIKHWDQFDRNTILLNWYAIK